ncbi:hypothetical protein B0T13DRAFT_512524 [Neurospora crassa]|nr:hypothetical protein B0T13DRAFT_512524 [Neurospora crassa]
MSEAISAIIFFGTPRGCYHYFYRRHVLSPRREIYLKAARKEFATLVTKLSPKIHVFCFYEEQPINLAETAHLLKFAHFIFPQG